MRTIDEEEERITVAHRGITQTSPGVGTRASSLVFLVEGVISMAIRAWATELITMDKVMIAAVRE